MKEFMPISKITKNCYFTKENVIQVIKVSPVNYELKSILEKQSILNSYNQFLKICDFEFQILIKSNKQNLEELFTYLNQINVNNLEHLMNKNKQKLLKEYLNLLDDFNTKSKMSTKEFYILIFESNVLNQKVEFNDILIKLRDKKDKIAENLARCGNCCEVLEGKELISFLKSYFLSEVNYE